MMRLLLISNSTNAGGEFLAHPLQMISKFIGKERKNILLIPYAAITIHYENYTERVNKKFNEIGHSVNSIHTMPNPHKAVEDSDIIVVGGGNTWQLLHTLQIKKLVSVIREKVLSGTPYIGWSAGSNICCPTIRTTNDMPVVECENTLSLNLVPFQINPHYLDSNPEGHAGETREERIMEYIHQNRNIYVVGLREGTMLLLEDNSLKLIGDKPARIFHFGRNTREIYGQEDLDFIMKNN